MGSPAATPTTPLPFVPGDYTIQVLGVGGAAISASSAKSFSVADAGVFPGAGTIVGEFSLKHAITLGSPVEEIGMVKVYARPQTEVSKGDLMGGNLAGTDLEPEPDKQALRVDLANDTTPVNGVTTPVLAVVDEMLIFGIPNNLEPGLYRLIIEKACGRGISIVDAIKLLGEPPANQPLVPSFTVWSAKVFNVSDRTRIVIDDNAILAEGFPGTDTSFSITANIVGLHKLRFEAYNLDNTNGTSWGFEVKANGKVVYRDVRGNNQNRTNANELLILPFMAMLDGGNDLQTGLVFAQDMYV